MKQIIGLVFLLLNSTFIFVALPATLENYPILEAVDEKNIKDTISNKTESKTPFEPGRKIEIIELPTNFKKYNKNKDIHNIEDQKPNDHVNSDFLSLEHRMPDFTDDEYSEINKDESTPWNFLKYLNKSKEVHTTHPGTNQNATHIYINIPIVINNRAGLPISLTIGDQHISLKETNEMRNPPLYIKLKDSKDSPRRETNRHRSSLHKKIYAHKDID